MRHHQPTRDYVERRTAEGLSKREIIRCLKRYIAREIYNNLPRTDSHDTTPATSQRRLDEHRSIERFHQTLKKWLRAQPHQPAPSPTCRPCSTASPRTTTTNAPTDHYRTEPPPPPTYTTRPKPRPPPTAAPTPTTASATTPSTPPATSPCASHGRLRHIGIGRTYARTRVILLVHDLDIRVINAATGELLRDLTLNPARDYQPRTAK